MPSSKFSRFSVTSFTTVLALLRIHLSAVVNLLLSILLKSTPSSKFISTNLAAFHILLAKFLPASTFSVENLRSFPGELPVVSANLSASVPYCSMTSSGSIPLPRDLLIFLPWASLTMPWMNTYLKGSLPVCSRAENIILATQKKMMS